MIIKNELGRENAGMYPFLHKMLIMGPSHQFWRLSRMITIPNMHGVVIYAVQL